MSDTRELYRRAMVAARDRRVLGEREMATMESLIGPLRGNILDLGCADRFLKLPCALRNLSYDSLDYHQIDFEVHGFSQRSDTVDTAVSLAVIEHIQNPAKFLAEIKRVLKPGGYVYLSTPNFQYDWKHFYDDPTHVRPYTPAGLEHLLTLHGFEDVRTVPGLRCKPTHWYSGPLRFWRAAHLLPFRGGNRYAPEFLRGRATSFIAIGRKPLNEAA